MKKEMPIVLSADQVRAVLAGNSTELIVAVDPQPEADPHGHGFIWRGGDALLRAGYGADYVHTGCESVELAMVKASPYQVGLRLWVKETWRVGQGLDHESVEAITASFEPDLGRDEWPYLPVNLKADDGCHGLGLPRRFGPRFGNWRGARTMPQWASRLTVEVAAVHAREVDWRWVYALELRPTGGTHG